MYYRYSTHVLQVYELHVTLHVNTKIPHMYYIYITCKICGTFVSEEVDTGIIDSYSGNIGYELNYFSFQSILDRFGGSP